MNLRFPRGFTLIFSLVFLLTIGVTGCGVTQTSQQKTPNEQTTPVENNDQDSSSPNTNKSNIPQEVTLYYPNKNAEGLVPIKRIINVTNEDSNKELTDEIYSKKLISEIFTELAAPPTEYVNPLPAGTKLIDSSIKDGVVTLNLSKEFKENFVGGATGEQMCLYSIVNTLTTLPNVKEVEFLLEGELKVAILGELDTTTPMPRNDSLIIGE